MTEREEEALKKYERVSLARIHRKPMREKVQLLNDSFKRKSDQLHFFQYSSNFNVNANL